MSRLRLVAFLCLTWKTCPTLAAELSVASLFSDHMVIQRDQPFKVWGWGDPGATVSISVAGQQKASKVGEDGRWAIKISAPNAIGPHAMKVSSGGSSLEIRDVLVGEVWLCSGQSNMAMTVSRARDFAKESKAADLPQIRMFKVTSSHATEPQEKCSGEWTVCTPDSVGGFSATAFFFGRRLHAELNVPIGLINSSVGGTSVESWTSMPAQSAVPDIAPRLQAWKDADDSYNSESAKAAFDKAMDRWTRKAKEARAAGDRAPRKPQLASPPHKDRNYPSNLFNGKIHPLAGFSIRGAVWYQGENSSGRGFSHLYHPQLTTLIRDWRQRWGQGDFPFAWVQLPNFRAPQKQPAETNGWTLVQEGMLKTLNEPNTGMAITLDVGEEKDIHPKDKQSVGHRLAQWALAKVYNFDIIPMGPVYAGHQISEGTVTIEFLHNEGLKSNGDEVRGFAVCGEDRKFVWADARIEDSRVIVSSESVPDPVAVRYAWAANPTFSIINESGIPASPFRTDNWEERGR